MNYSSLSWVRTSHGPCVQLVGAEDEEKNSSLEGHMQFFKPVKEKLGKNYCARQKYGQLPGSKASWNRSAQRDGRGGEGDCGGARPA